MPQQTPNTLNTTSSPNNNTATAQEKSNRVQDRNIDVRKKNATEEEKVVIEEETAIVDDNGDDDDEEELVQVPSETIIGSEAQDEDRSRNLKRVNGSTNSNFSSSSTSSASSADSADGFDNDDWEFDDANDDTPTPHSLYKRGGRSYSSNSIGNSVDEESISFINLLNPGITVNVSKRAFTNVKSRTKKIKDRAKLQKDKFINKINDEELIILKTKLAKHLTKLDKNLLSTVNASKTEKLFYAFALFQIFYAGILIGKYPNYFHWYYSVLFCLLMPIRLYTYWKREFQYFLADLCYYVNVLVMLYIWVFPHSEHLFVVCFGFSFGTLSFAVITWRNSLVLHSIEKITSSFIHIIPPATLFVITHEVLPDYKRNRFPGAAKVTSWNSINGILWTSFYYLIWQSAYHYFITYKLKNEIKKGRVNSFSWLRKSYAKKPIGRLVNSLPEPLPVVAFTLIQYGYQLGTMLLCPLWIKYKRLASLFMAFIFIVASYNGASYYLDVFGKKLEKEVLKLQNEISQLQAESLLNGSLSNASINEESKEGEGLDNGKHDTAKTRTSATVEEKKQV